MLWVLSVSDAWEALLSPSVTFRRRTDGKSWTYMSRKRFHLDSEHPLSKHRAQLTNESDGQTGSEEWAVFRE